MNKTLHRQTRTVMALAAAAVLAACASAPANNARLDEARSAYNSAATNANVVRSAPVELQQAQQALQKADAALLAGDDAANVEHFAYLARQRTEVAMQAGRIAEADLAVSQAQAQRDRILIDARSREATAQRASAEQERAAAETSRMAADQARTEAEAARKLAEERLAAAEAARQQTALARTRNATLEAEMAALKAKQTERGMVLTLGDVLFDSGRSTLKAGAMRTIDQLASFLDKNPTRKVLIEGHTDSVGADAFNRQLSEERATAVRRALQDRRVNADRVAIAGLGEGYPVASNDTAAGRQQNRRVEVIFSDDTGNIRARTN